MTTRITLDKAGRIVIPESLREELHIETGDSLELEVAGDQITLRFVRGTSPLTKEQGVWVFRTDQPLSDSVTDETMHRLREDRDRHSLGD